MIGVLILSIVTASISFTVTETVLFKPWREWIKTKNQWVGKLFSCGYCLGHWVSFFLTAIYRPRLLDSGLWPVDYFLTAIAIAWLAGFQWVLMSFFFDLAKK